MSRLSALLRRLWPFGRADGAGDATDASSEDSDSERDGSIWDAIPSWQYGGRHAESGGIARGEQERALRDIQRRAESEEERDRNRQ